ncbi:MAG: hypothetical protein J0I41_04465 [Filimonas sp.]|nr:hypothetical protein [Filimonas sp.]
MAQQAITEMTIEQLEKNKARYKGILTGFCFLWGVMIGVFIYALLFKSGRVSKVSPALLVVVLGSVTTMLPMFNQLKAVNNELKKRNTNAQ